MLFRSNSLIKLKFNVYLMFTTRQMGEEAREQQNTTQIRKRLFHFLSGS